MTSTAPGSSSGFTPDLARPVAFIGLGMMGLPMASNLVTAGYDVVGFDTAREATRRLRMAGGRSADDLGGAVSSAAAVILMLPDSDIVERVVHYPAFALRPGTPVIDMSSSEPIRTQRLGEELAARGHPLVDAPVSGGTSGAVSGDLTIMAGGEASLVARLGALFTPLGHVTHVGPLGSGHALKALNNLLSATHLLATAEVMAVGQKFGLTAEAMLEVINASSGRCGSTETKWPRFVATDRYDSGFRLSLMLKDMQIAVRLATEVGVPADLASDALRLWSRAGGDLRVDADHTEIARWVGSMSDHGE